MFYFISSIFKRFSMFFLLFCLYSVTTLAQYNTSDSSLVIKGNGVEKVSLFPNYVAFAGPLKLTNQTVACAGTQQGYIRYNGADKIIEYCNGANWLSIKGAGFTNIPTFSFKDNLESTLNSYIYSNIDKVTNFVDSRTISISSDTTAEYSINGGAWTSAAGVIYPNQFVQVRLMASSSPGVSNLATLTIGVTSDTFNVTTKSKTPMFYTRSSYSGNLGGLAGADAICQADAEYYGYEGTWKAFLSSGTESVASRFSNIVYPVVRATNRSQVMDSSNIFDGSLSGVILGGYFDVWTGSNANGTSNANNCNNWTADDYPASGQIGQTDEVDDDWINYSDRYCDTLMKFMCIQD